MCCCVCVCRVPWSISAPNIEVCKSPDHNPNPFLPTHVRTQTSSATKTHFNWNSAPADTERNSWGQKNVSLPTLVWQLHARRNPSTIETSSHHHTKTYHCCVRRSLHIPRNMYLHSSLMPARLLGSRVACCARSRLQRMRMACSYSFRP